MSPLVRIENRNETQARRSQRSDRESSRQHREPNVVLGHSAETIPSSLSWGSPTGFHHGISFTRFTGFCHAVLPRSSFTGFGSVTRFTGFTRFGSVTGFARDDTRHIPGRAFPVSAGYDEKHEPRERTEPRDRTPERISWENPGPPVKEPREGNSVREFPHRRLSTGSQRRRRACGVSGRRLTLSRP